MVRNTRKSHLVRHAQPFTWTIEEISPRDLLLGVEHPFKSPSFECGPAVLHLELCFVSEEVRLRVVESGSDHSSWCTEYGISLRPRDMFPKKVKKSPAPIKFSNIDLTFSTKMFENYDNYSDITVKCLFFSASLEHKAQCESETETKTNESEAEMTDDKKTDPTEQLDSPSSERLQNVPKDPRSSGINSKVGNENTNPVHQEDTSLSISLEKVPEDSRSSGEMSKITHGSDIEQGLSSLSINMEHMLENSRFSDVTLKVGGDTLKAHKDVLACRSEVFGAMFESGMKEELKNEVNLVEMKSGTAKEMLKYIYSGKIQELSMDRAMDLYVAADRYDLQELKGWCKGFICKHISAGDVCKVAALADLHSDENLAQAAKRVFKEESKSVLAMEGWRDFAKKNPDVYTDLVECFIKSQ